MVAAARSPFLVFLLVFVFIFILHVPLLGLPYYWDEAGYFVPAARDLYLSGDPVPSSTLSNAHPPLVMAYLALAWKVFGEGQVQTRAAMLVVAALALTALFVLARRAANERVAWATVLVTALYPVFFAQSTLAHLDMAAAALTLWALVLYLPAGDEIIAGRDDEKIAGRDVGAADLEASAPDSLNIGRRAGAVALFALAGLAKETALLAPLALAGWESLCWLLGRRRDVSRLCLSARRPVWWPLTLLAASVPLFLWLAYHRRRTGYFFGNPEYFRYNVEQTMNLARVLEAGWGRLWQVTAYMNLFVLTAAALVLMLFFKPVRDETGERPRIGIAVQLVFAVLVAAYVAALSVVGGAVIARYMLPVVPLVILICVSTVWRRVYRWKLVVGAVCLAFALGIVVNPPRAFPWEENLAYRDFILLHRGAEQFIAGRYPEARVLTTWPATDELRNPYFGYTERAVAVVPVENFKRESLEAAARERGRYDLALLFSTHGGLELEEATRVLGGRVVYREERRGQWVAVLEK